MCAHFGTRWKVRRDVDVHRGVWVPDHDADKDDKRMPSGVLRKVDNLVVFDVDWVLKGSPIYSPIATISFVLESSIQHLIPVPDTQPQCTEV